MARTSTEDLLRNLKRSQRSSGILVPLIEQFMRKPIEIEDDEDRDFIQKLVLARSQPRKKGVYSPSLVSECLRKVYFLKTGMEHKRVERIELSGYFNGGNWQHFKWQFVMWKMHRAGIIQLIDTGSICIGTEVPVKNERGDFGGTIDNLIYIPGTDFIGPIDWKGMNANNFQKALADGPPRQYTFQSAGYAGLANSSLTIYHPDSYDPNYPPEAQRTSELVKITDFLIVYENKNGPISNRLVKSPLGLKEFRFKLEDFREPISARIKTLRAHERKQETPDPECTNTRTAKFKDCPFAPICRGEIERSERRQMKAKKDTKATKKKKKRMVQFNREKR